VIVMLGCFAIAIAMWIASAIGAARERDVKRDVALRELRARQAAAAEKAYMAEYARRSATVPATPRPTPLPLGPFTDDDFAAILRGTEI